jgi:hypothetical protein
MKPLESASDLLLELEAFADPPSFLELCREIRDSMYFYDRDVLVAMVTSVFEGMVVGLLLAASLEGAQALKRTDAAMRQLLRRLPYELRRGRFAMDAQAVLARFVELGVPSAYAAYESMYASFRAWERGARVPADPERNLYRARLAMDEGDEDRARQLLAGVGCAVLQGYRVRPVWLRISGRMGGLLNGIFAIREALLTHPFLSYPLQSVREERERLRWQHKVFDLQEIRRLRGAEETAAGVDGGYDETDVMWDSILSEGPVVRREDFLQLERLGARALYPLLTVIRAREFRRSKATFVALHQLIGSRSRETVHAVLHLLSEVSADDPLFSEGVRVLEAAGPASKEAVLDFVEAETDARKKVPFAGLVARYRGEERALSWLLKTFSAIDWAEGKAEVALSLGRYGDARAIPALRAALSGDKRADRPLELAILALGAQS